MWQTNEDMIRGLTRFSWVGGWVAFGCAGAAVALGLVSVLLSNALWPGLIIAGVAGGLMVAMLGRLQRVHDLRAKLKSSNQLVSPTRDSGARDEE